MTYGQKVKFCLFCAGLLACFQVFSQTGPGGVGIKSGQTTLILWLDAAEGVSFGADNKVTSWNDLSGYDNHALGIAPNNQPVLQSGAIYGLPSVKFDGMNDRLRIPGRASLQPNNITILAVVKRTGTTGWGDIISRPYSTSWNSPYTSYTLCACNAHHMGYDGNYPFSQVAIGNGVQVVNWNPPHGIIPNNQTYIHALAYNYHGHGMGSFLNNGIRGDDDIAIIPAIGNLDYNGNTLDVSIGARSEYVLNPEGDHYLKGDIAEIIMYNYDLSEVEHIIVVNYLATKYNISIGWDQYNEVSGFTTNPIGLGREDKQEEQHQNSSGGNLTLSCTNFNQNTSYIFAAHNNGKLKGQPISQPSGYDNRLERVWYMQSKGTKPETITLSFTFPVNPSSNHLHYGLLYSFNQDFGNPIQVKSASSVNVAQKTITFNVPGTNFPDGFYTLATKVNHWYGENTNWDDIINWDGHLPTSLIDVIITGSCNNYPFLTKNAVCRSMEIQQGGVLNIGNYTLDMYGNFIASGNDLISGTTGTLCFKGTTTSNIWAGSLVFRNLISEKAGGGSLYTFTPVSIAGNFSIVSGMYWAQQDPQLTLGGNLTIAEIATTITPGLEITCDGDGIQLLATNNFSISKLIINNIFSQVDISNSNIDVTSIEIQSGKLKAGGNSLQNITLSASGTLELTGTVYIRRNIENNGGTLIHHEMKTVFNHNLNQSLKSGDWVFFDVDISKSGGSLQLFDQMSLEGNLTVTSGGFSHNNQKILFIGALNQQLSTNGMDLYNIEIAKTTGYLEMTDDVLITNDLTVTSGALHTGLHQLTVNGSISNLAGAGGLVINSDENGSGSLIHFTANVPATINRYIQSADWQDGSDGWHLLATPVEDQGITGDWIPSGHQNDYDFYAWDENIGLWRNQKVPENNILRFIRGKGYLVAYQQTGIKSFIDKLNTGSVSTILSNSSLGDYAGWNLLGNPYPSAIDWYLVNKELFEDDFAYIYNSAKDGGAGYEAIDGGIENAYIPSNQGFFVLANPEAHNEEFFFSNDHRVHGGEFMKSTSDADFLKLRIAHGQYYDETLIRRKNSSSQNRDRSDAIKLFSYNTDIPQIYTVTDDLFNLAINSIPTITESLIIPVAIKVYTNSLMTITLTGISGAFHDQGILIHDSTANIYHNLAQISDYHFMANINDDKRFYLKFNPLGVSELSKINQIQAFISNNMLQILNLDSTIESVEILNLQGQTMFSSKIENESLNIPFMFSSGVYLLRLRTNESIFTKKIIKPI